jgi:hypothetical protein
MRERDVDMRAAAGGHHGAVGPRASTGKMAQNNRSPVEDSLP